MDVFPKKGNATRWLEPITTLQHYSVEIVHFFVMIGTMTGITGITDG